MGKSRQQENQPEQTDGLANEIWGIAFIAIGLLVMIALVSALRGTAGNILGPIGARLSLGLFYLFGPLPATLVPLSIMAIGLMQVRGKPLQLRLVIVWSLVTFEVCVLSAVHKLPLTTAETFDLSHFLSSNFLGSLVTWLLHFIFGAHRFGPYFLFILALFLTVLAGFRISLKTLFTALVEAFRIGRNTVVRGIRHFRSLRKRGAAADIPASLVPDNTPARERVKTRAKKEPPETEIPPEPDTAPEEAGEEAKRVYEEQLAAFRAKKNEPIKISTPDALENDVPAEEPPLDDDDGDIPDVFNRVPENIEDEPDVVDEEIEDDDTADADSFTPVKPQTPQKPYEIPSPDTISDPPLESSQIDRDAIGQHSGTLEKTLLNFGVEGKVVNVSPGPVIYRYEIELAPGIKVSRVVSLQDDISMAVGGQKIRIEAPIPGKAAIGIELPSPNREIVHFKHILQSDAFRKSKAKIPVVIGRSIAGMPLVADISRMPHLLIAGQTGSGKSVCINCLICSMLMTKTPEELRLIMIDPKKVELSSFEGIPHLLSPVVTESKEAVKALQWGVMEMERRYRLLAKMGVRNIDSFNARIVQGSLKKDIIPEEDNKLLPFIVILVDELADLMMTASRDVEGLVQRVAQLARAVGLHLIVATQRPSVDIITGPIKANLTSRIAFRTIQSTDSRTILGHNGAEKLLGMGDMLFLRNGAPDIERYHGAFISEEDVEALVGSIRSQYIDIDKIDSFERATGGSSMASADGGSGDRDELFVDAAEITVNLGQGSTSLLQRRMKIGYARAGRLMDELEKAGIVGPQEGSKMREVLITPEELREHLQALGITL